MAETELAIVVRARDQLTATLRQMGTTVEELSRKVASDFGRAGAAAELVGAGLRRAVPPASELQREVAQATAEMQRLGQADVGRLQIAITTTRAEVERLRAAAATDLIPGDAVAKAAVLEEELRAAEQAMASLQRAADQIDIASRIAQAEQAVASLGENASLQPLEAEIARAKVQLEAMRTQATLAGGKIDELDKQKMDGLTAGIAEGERALIRLRGGTEQAKEGASILGRTFTTVGASIKSAILPLLPILTLAGAAFAAKESVTEALALEDALSKINAEANLTTAELDNLRRGALETSRALGLAESEAAPALLSAVTDGASSAADGLDRFSASARLAASLGAEVGKAVDLQTSILNAYRDANLSAGRAADVTFGIVRGGKVEIEELAGSLDAVLPLAAGLGVSFEELGAIIVTATQRGGGFAQGMQAVRAVLGALTNAGPEARAALEGVDFSSYRIRAQGLVPVLEDISKKLGGNTNAIRAVFPDGRALGAVLAVLSNESSGLSASLSDLVGSTGAVEDALGRRLQSPMVQLGIIVNQLRSQFGEALGGAFLRGVERAVEALGGMEATSKAVADVAKSLGSVFGAVFPAIASVIAEATRGLQSFIEGIGGADAISERMKVVGEAIADVLRASLAIARAEIEALVRAILLIPQTISAAKDEWDAYFSGDQQQAIAHTRREVEFLEAALASMGGVKFDSLKAAAEFRSKLNELLSQTGGRATATSAVVRIAYQADEISRGDLEGALAAAKKRIEDLGETQVKGQAFEELKSKVDAVTGSIDRAGLEFANLDDAMFGLGEAFTADVAAPAERTFKTVKAELAGVSESIEIAKNELRFLGGTAARAFSELEGDELRTFLAELASRAAGADKALAANQDSARRLKDELSTFVAADIAETERSIRLLERTMRDAVSQAALLGLRGDQAAEAVAAVGTSEDERRLEALRGKLAGLRKELADLRSSVPETLVVASKIQAPSFRDLFDQAIAGARDVASRVADAFDPAVLAQIGRESGLALREEILAGVGTIDPFEETLRLFRGGIEPSLERQVQLIDDQVDRQRDATDELRQALPVLRALGLLSEKRIDLLDQETAKLAQSADLIRRRAALETAGLRRQALELGIDPKLDEGELRVQIEEARDLAERQQLAISLGVKVDDKAIVEAQQELQRRAESLSLRQLQREAIYFGLAIDGRAPAQLEADIADARDEAQAFADALGDRGVRSEAIVLGISIDGKSTGQIEQDIRKLQTEAREFAARNPIGADLLRGAIDGGSRAIADIVTGAKKGKEALRDFFSSMAAQAAQAAAQLLIVKTLIAAFGTTNGAQNGFGAFLASAFGAAKGHAITAGGAVMAFARGAGFEAGSRTSPASAGGAASSRSSGALPIALAYALGGMPVLPVHTAAPTPVERYALGGSPHIDRIVDRPTLERSERLAGAAIVPLSGGGVATTDGGKLPVQRRGSELVVMRQAAAHALGGAPGEVLAHAYATGGAPLALFGEAGPESVMRMHRAPDGRPGLRASDGAVLPLTRVEGGRLGVEAHALGGAPATRLDAQVGARHGVASGALLQNAWSANKAHALAAFAQGGIPGPLRTEPSASVRNARTSVRPLAAAHALEGAQAAAFALGGAPGAEAAVRAALALAAPYANGGAPGPYRAVRPEMVTNGYDHFAPFAQGGASALSRTLRTDVLGYAAGGAPGLERELRTVVQPFAAGGGILDQVRTVRTLALGGLPADAPDANRTLRTLAAPYDLGGAPGLERELRTLVKPFAAGGAIDLARTVRSNHLDARALVETYALGGRPDRRAPPAFPIGDAPASAIRTAAPVRQAAAPAPVLERDRGPASIAVEVSPQIQLVVTALDPRTAADVILAQKKTIVQAVAEELARSPAVRAAIRGDRS